MSKFPKFDEKETKEGNIRRFVAKCLERMKRDNVRQCEDENIEEIIKILSELLSETEAKHLLSIANYDKILGKDEKADFSGLEDKFFEFNEKTSDYEKFLKSFYYDVLPTVMIADFHRFGEVRNDFLRYFILWDNFAEKRRRTLSVEWIPKYRFEASKLTAAEKLNKFDNIKKLYEFAASEIDCLFYKHPACWCFYNVLRGLFNNIAFFKALIEEKMLQPEDVLDITFYPHLFGMLEFLGMPDNEKFEFDVFDRETKLKYAEILFSWDAMTGFLADDDPSRFSEMHNGSMMPYVINRKFFSLMQRLNPEYEMPIIERVAKREVKKIFVGEINYDIDFFSCHADVLVSRCRRYCGEEAIEKREVKLFLLGLFLREKILGREHFKKMPELFRQLVVVEQMRSIFKKAEIVVVPDLPETDIDKDQLKKDVDKFLGELAKIARNGGRPSDYYAGELTAKINGVADSASWPASMAFDVAVSFLRDSFSPWKAAKPMLAIFRNLKDQAYSIDMEDYDYERCIWAFVPLRITPLLGSLESEEAAKVCEEWFKHLADQLKSADDFVVKKREENPETVPEEFREGYDITVVEPHPLWREAFCEAAGDLRVNLGFNNCKVFNHLQKNDIDKDVREAAAKTLERIEKIKGKFDSGSRKRALLNAWWWYRVAHLKSLGIDFDWVSAQNLKSREVKINYPKN